ncbi:MAG: hypothetical protein K2N48_01765 [Muribaculaceae bacterium]|nr:hypothetical protein [Muribaculaceae bacterium]
MKSTTRNYICSYLCLILLGIAIWWMSANVVWLGDDLDYKYMMKGEIWQSWGKIKTVEEFFDSQYIHYHHVNGRFVAHSLVQIFNAKLGQQWFAVCNAVVYILFVLLLSKAGGVRISENPGGIISAICLSILCFITKMMPTCQIGYIWAMTANISWIMLFFSNDRPSWPTTLFMAVAGIIVGNWQESLSIGVCGGIGVWWIVRLLECIKYDEIHFDWRKSWMILGYVAGTATNCLAPSTIGRVAGIDMPLLDQLLIASYSFPAIIALIICILYSKNKHRKLRIFAFKNTDRVVPEGFLLTSMLFLIAFNTVIGIYSNRQLFGANMFAAILTLQIMPRHRFGYFVNSLATIFIIAFWVLMIQGIHEVKRQYDAIRELHSKSSDGSVYFDRKRVMTLGFPLRAKYFEDILGQFDNDLHHSLMKDFKHTRKGRGLKLKPTDPIVGERINCYAPGHFTVTLEEPPKGEAPREVLVYGHYFLPQLAAQPRRLPVKRYSKRKPPFATAVIIPEFPFFTADSISIIEN